MGVAMSRWNRVLAAIGALSALLSFLVGGSPAAEASGESIQFQTATSEAPEGGSPVVNVVLTNRTPRVPAVSVTVSAVGSGENPAEPGDFVLASTTVVFPPLALSGTVRPVSIRFPDDQVFEGPETVTLTITGTSLGNSAFGDQLSHTATIIDNDDVPTVSINDATFEEGTESMGFTITRNGATELDTKVAVHTTGVTATPGADFTPRSDTVIIHAGDMESSTGFAVPIIDDAIDEDVETFAVELSDATNAKIAKPNGTGTILDDDKAGIVIDEDDGISVLEGAAPDSFKIALASQPVSDVELMLNTDPAQLSLSPSILTFDAGNWSDAQSVSISAIEDGIDEPDPHTAQVTVTAASNDPRYKELGADLIATIGDADALLVDIQGPSVGAAGQPAAFRAVVNAGGTGPITYSWTAFKDGNEVAVGGESTFQFTPSGGGAFIIQVIVGDDQGQNPAEFVEYRALTDIGESIFGGDILWLAEEGISKGCNPPDNTMFCPDDFVTRGQMAAFLARALGLTGNQANNFTDDDGSIYEHDITTIAAAGITQGCNPPDNTRFCPDDFVTRGQMAAFLRRTDEMDGVNPQS
jgi:hypothetical protein